MAAVLFAQPSCRRAAGIEGVLLARIECPDTCASAKIAYADVFGAIAAASLEESVRAANSADDAAAEAALDLTALQRLAAACMSNNWAAKQHTHQAFIARLVKFAAGKGTKAPTSPEQRESAMVALGRMAACKSPQVAEALARSGASVAALAAVNEATKTSTSAKSSGLDASIPRGAKAAYLALGSLLSRPGGIVRLGMAQLKKARQEAAAEGRKTDYVQVRDVQVSLFRELLPAWATGDAECLAAASRVVASAQAGMLEDDVLAEAGLVQFATSAFDAKEGAGHDLDGIAIARLLAGAAAALGHGVRGAAGDSADSSSSPPSGSSGSGALGTAATALLEAVGALDSKITSGSKGKRKSKKG